ncbi:hypothetical protein B0T09DRAFT_252633 [Sordaria sp. MPI-SDFR-AT-0083]|nr:hypothetical protein B0T09DRAFT_252633 [Sordaria sp. MPI-SDFR-AT-0083]
MLQPIPASTLLPQDPRISRLRGHDRNGLLFSTGCRELDSHVLLGGGATGAAAAAGARFEGGFEPGCVVGISSEEETIGLGIGLQVVARMLLSSSDPASIKSKEGKAKAMIITTLSTTSLLPMLRLALVSEARVLLLQGDGSGNGQQQQVDRATIKSCLERVLVARVFDAEGLREVLRELEESTSTFKQNAPALGTSSTASATEEEEEEEGHNKERTQTTTQTTIYHP